jgi:hypothetical protein
MLKTLLVVAVIASAMQATSPVSNNTVTPTSQKVENYNQNQRPIPPTHVVIDPSAATEHFKTESANTVVSSAEKPLPRFLRPDWVIVYITAIYSLIAWFTLLSIKRQADTMARQAEDSKKSGKHTETLAEQAVRQSDLTQRQLDLTNRPWLAIDFVNAASSLEFKQDGSCWIFLGYRVRNVGHSVAQHVQPWVEVVINGVDNMLEVKERISAQLRKPVSSNFDHGRLVFPTQSLVDSYPVHISPERMSKALDNSPFQENDGSRIRGIGIELFVCFDYQSTLEPSRHHQTQSIYLLGYAGPNNAVSGLFMPTRRIYPQTELTLTFKGFGAYAD